MLCFHPLNSEYFLVYLLLCDGKLNIFGLVEKQQNKTAEDLIFG